MAPNALGFEAHLATDGSDRLATIILSPYSKRPKESTQANETPNPPFQNSFSSIENYWYALWALPCRLRCRAIAAWSAADAIEANEVASKGGELQKQLEWYDLFFFGVGTILGGGIFVTAGRTAEVAGPAMTLSYALAGISVMLSALCYTEFAAELPSAGGAYTYLHATLGEFPAFLTGAALLIEYILSGAAIARSVTSYLSVLLGAEYADQWRLQVPALGDVYGHLDVLALSFIVLLTAIACYSTKDSSAFSIGTTAVFFALLVFIIGAGFYFGEVQNLYQPGGDHKASGYMPFGIDGVFQGASMAYFSYIGYDAIATMAEECRDPRQALPIGLLGSVAFSTVAFCLMTLSLTFLVPYDLINASAPFSVAFERLKFKVSADVAGIAAVIGTITTVLVHVIGMARYLVVIGRSSMLPGWFAHISRCSGTPINATLSLSAVMGAVALLVRCEALISVVAVAAIFVFIMVAQALTFRRHVAKGVNSPYPTIAYLLVFPITCMAFVYFYHCNEAFFVHYTSIALAAFLETYIFALLCPEVDMPKKWTVPGMQWAASLSIFLNIFLLGTLTPHAYFMFGGAMLAATLLYCLYSVHASWDAEVLRSYLPRISQKGGNRQSSLDKVVPTTDGKHESSSPVSFPPDLRPTPSISKESQ